MSEKIFITSLHLAGTAAVFWILMLAVFRKKCGRAVVSTVTGLRREKNYRLGGIMLIAGIAVNFILVILQNRGVISPAVDFTGALLNRERSVVEFFQNYRFFYLDYTAAFAYFLLFPALLLFVMPVLDYTGNVKALEQYLCALSIALFIAVPCFVLIEVREVWMNFAPGTYFSSSEICQAMFNLRSFNFPGNCFPSIHTALTVIAMYCVCKTKCPYYIILATAGGLLILASILVLGIHWITDMLAGGLTALAALKVAAMLQKNKN